MLKKAGILTAGVTAALLAGAPLASAGEAPSNDKDSNKSKSHDDNDNNGKHKKKHKKHNNGGDDITCDASGGDVLGNEGDGLVAGIGSALDGNAGQIASCNSFLNDNLNDNKLGIDVL